jgi:hypothetical protein
MRSVAGKYFVKTSGILAPIRKLPDKASCGHKQIQFWSDVFKMWIRCSCDICNPTLFRRKYNGKKDAS